MLVRFQHICTDIHCINMGTDLRPTSRHAFHGSQSTFPLVLFIILYKLRRL